MSTLVFNESEHDPIVCSCNEYSVSVRGGTFFIIGVPVSFPETLLNADISRETRGLTHIKNFQSAAFKESEYLTKNGRTSEVFTTTVFILLTIQKCSTQGCHSNLM
jgi:hypothetical protein